MFDVPLAAAGVAAFPRRPARRSRDEDVARRADRRAVRQRQEHHRPATVRRCVYQPAASGRQDRAVIDGLGERPIKEITGLFTAVGFSSPPSWVKPYHVLSNGEQFRCDLARGRWRKARQLARDAESGDGEMQPKTGNSPSPASPPVGRAALPRWSSSTNSPAWSIATWPGWSRRPSPKGMQSGPDRRPLRGRHLPLRRDRVAPAGLGHRHGHVDFQAEVSSSTADRA